MSEILLIGGNSDGKRIKATEPPAGLLSMPFILAGYRVVNEEYFLERIANGNENFYFYRYSTYTSAECLAKLLANYTPRK